MHLENNSNPRKNSRYQSMSVFFFIFFFLLVNSRVKLLIMKINQYFQDQTNYRIYIYIYRERERERAREREREREREMRILE